jgi:ferredoxin-NADP reductase
MKMRMVKRQPETPTAESFFWQPSEVIHFTAGQYLEWHLPHPEEDDRGDVRWFTISASPTDEFIRLTTKFNPKGSTFKKTLKALEIGAEVEAINPEGDFVLPDNLKQPLVFVAGGIGITPFRSMLKYAADKKLDLDVQLIYAAKTVDEFAFKAELESTGLRPTYVVTDQDGLLTGKRIQTLAGGLDGKLVYLSGPEPMVKDFRSQLLDLSVPGGQIKIDDFPGYVE